MALRALGDEEEKAEEVSCGEGDQGNGAPAHRVTAAHLTCAIQALSAREAQGHAESAAGGRIIGRGITRR